MYILRVTLLLLTRTLSLLALSILRDSPTFVENLVYIAYFDAICLLVGISIIDKATWAVKKLRQIGRGLLEMETFRDYRMHDDAEEVLA